MSMTAGNERRRVLVTGGRRGIGRGIAYAFAAAGYDVVINDLVDDEAGRETLAGIADRGGRGAFALADVAGSQAMGSCSTKPRHLSAGSTCWSTMPASRSPSAATSST